MHMLITGVLLECRVSNEEKHLLLFGAQVLKASVSGNALPCEGEKCGNWEQRY